MQRGAGLLGEMPSRAHRAWRERSHDSATEPRERLPIEEVLASAHYKLDGERVILTIARKGFCVQAHARSRVASQIEIERRLRIASAEFAQALPAREPDVEGVSADEDHAAPASLAKRSSGSLHSLERFTVVEDGFELRAAQDLHAPVGHRSDSLAQFVGRHHAPAATLLLGACA